MTKLMTPVVAAIEKEACVDHSVCVTIIITEMVATTRIVHVKRWTSCQILSKAYDLRVHHWFEPACECAPY